MASKPNTPKGTRDFSAKQVQKRHYIINTIKTNFEAFGFQPIETPSFENYETLMGKYGEEGDRLIFKILNSGDYLSKADFEILSNKESLKLTPQISEKALRYDLTVPFARYVVQHQNEIEFPFKRYQIQPVWRADRPQKGRFREFFQCDADVVGSKSLWQEIELIQLYDTVYSQLGIDGAIIKINNRKILSGIAQVLGLEDKLIHFTVALDKLDKIGKDGVKKEMIEKGIQESAIEKIAFLFDFKGLIEEKIKKISNLLASSQEGLEGIQELEFIFENVMQLGLKNSKLELDLSLARGLHYYTGAIFEISPPPQVSIGSIGGGGRYDNLTGVFGLSNISGVGISFGLDRIFLVMEELNLFPKNISSTPTLLFINCGNKEVIYSMKAIKTLRENGIKTELYPDAIKIGKQLHYANKRGINLVVIAGETEINQEKFSLKNLLTGEQFLVDFNELEKKIENH